MRLNTEFFGNVVSKYGEHSIYSEKMDLNISISNSLGQVLMENQINGEKGSNRINFDASKYSNGLHFLEVLVDGKSIIRKFIVQH